MGCPVCDFSGKSACRGRSADLDQLNNSQLTGPIPPEATGYTVTEAAHSWMVATNSPHHPTSGLSLRFLCADFFSSRFFFESQKVQGKNVNLLAFEAGLPGDDGLRGDGL